MPEQGEVWFNSVPRAHHDSPGARAAAEERFGWIGSDPQLVPELTTWENAALPLLLRGASHRAAKKAATEWLERLDIAALAKKRPHALLQADASGSPSPGPCARSRR
ncbi:ABC transporter ATP-binding protein OS=Streptomyces microflavus OX=1919 GN=Smic_61270 PE=4 SV=1 [Streptomyces microflavus]